MVRFSCPEPYRLLVTCEHGGNDIPDAYRHLFTGSERILASHRAYDPGALDFARLLASSFHAELVATTYSRLLVDCNRSAGNRNVFSEYSRVVDLLTRKRILARYYQPHHEAVRKGITRIVRPGAVPVHVAVHSFAPELRGTVRNADIGLLYDPAREAEKKLCTAWQRELVRLEPSLRVRRNYPYLGKTDGLPTMLRKEYPAMHYIGVELEINQAAGQGGLKALLDRILPASLNPAVYALVR